MFASKTPRDLNHDRHPYRCAKHSGMIYRDRADDGQGHCRSEQPTGHHRLYAPRPEFDHVQHNEPNLILTCIRDGYHDVESALDLLGDDAREWWTPIVTDAMIDHAHKVLTRLAALS